MEDHGGHWLAGGCAVLLTAALCLRRVPLFVWVILRLALILGLVALFLAGLWLCLVYWPLALVALAAAAAGYRKPWQGDGWSHGTAGEATRRERERAGMHSGVGLALAREIPEAGGKPPLRAALDALADLPIGQSEQAVKGLLFAGGRWGLAGGRMVRLPDYTHTAVFAPTGKGKGVSLVIPQLLTYTRGGLVVLDVKGELWDTVSAYRREVLGRKTFRLYPWAKGGSPDCLNPFDLIPKGDVSSIDMARSVSSAMVTRTGEEKEPFWADMAESILATFSAAVLELTDDEDRHLGSVRELLTDPEQYEGMIEQLRQMEGPLGRMGGQVAHLEKETKSSALATADAHSLFLDSPLVEQSVKRTTFDPRGILPGRGDTDVFLTIDPDKLKSHSRLLRLWLATLINLCLREGSERRGEVLFLLDECGTALGQMMAPLETALVEGRGAGVRLMMVFQSYDQAKQMVHGKENLIVDNCRTTVWFGTKGYQSAELLSNSMGDRTIPVESHSRNRSESWQRGGMNAHERGVNVSTSENTSAQQIGRKLMFPAEILTMPPDQMLIFHDSMPVVRARQARWFDDPHFAKAARWIARNNRRP